MSSPRLWKKRLVLITDPILTRVADIFTVMVCCGHILNYELNNIIFCLL